MVRDPESSYPLRAGVWTLGSIYHGTSESIAILPVFIWMLMAPNSTPGLQIPKCLLETSSWKSFSSQKNPSTCQKEKKKFNILSTPFTNPPSPWDGQTESTSPCSLNTTGSSAISLFQIHLPWDPALQSCCHHTRPRPSWPPTEIIASPEGTSLIFSN